MGGKAAMEGDVAEGGDAAAAAEDGRRRRDARRAIVGSEPPALSEALGVGDEARLKRGGRV